MSKIKVNKIENNSTKEVKDCFMCIRGITEWCSQDIYDVRVRCNSINKEHQDNFDKRGRFCAEYCSGYRTIA